MNISEHFPRGGRSIQNSKAARVMGYVSKSLAGEVPSACFSKWSFKKKGVSAAKAADTPDLLSGCSQSQNTTLSASVKSKVEVPDDWGSRNQY